MSLTVEDGTAKTSANSYASVATFLGYWAERNVDLSDEEVEALEAALLKACQYIDTRYHGRWKGRRYTEAQAMAWPRIGARDSDGYPIPETAIPTRLVHAACEYAKRALGAELAPDPTANPNVVSETKTAGPVSKSVTYAGGAALEVLRPYPSADMLLKDLLIPVGGSWR